MTTRNVWPAAATVLCALFGCADDHRPPNEAHAGRPIVELGARFDPAQTGTIRGKILWNSPVPAVEAFEVFPDKSGQPDLPERGSRRNPHAPHIDEQTHGVGQAVVFLRQVDPLRSRPWHHPPVRVEQSDWRLIVRQGNAASAVGFVRRGDTFEAISKQKVLHILHGEGSAFFSLPFPDPERASTWLLDRAGYVGLSSGADYFWMRAHLFVDDHPYYARSDGHGQFTLTQVPAGEYQLVCWLPNWHIQAVERDAESGVRARVLYHAPLEKEKAVTVTAGQTTAIDFMIAQSDFKK